MADADADGRAQWARDTVRLLNLLPARSVRVLSLMYFGRLSQEEVCAQTGWSERSVRAASGAGLGELGRLLQDATYQQTAPTTP